VNRQLIGLGLAAACALAAAGGCSRAQRNDDFLPREEVARAALDAYLQAWSRGSTAQAVPGTSPPVMVNDELRLKGRTLKGYQILGPVPADAPLCYAVQLNMDNPA